MDMAFYDTGIIGLPGMHMRVSDFFIMVSLEAVFLSFLHN
jgi:hypothetical protein